MRRGEKGRKERGQLNSQPHHTTQHHRVATPPRRRRPPLRPHKPHAHTPRTLVAFFFLAAGFFFLGAAFLAAWATLYEPLFLTRTPDLTPAARPAFRKRFLSGAMLRYFLIAWRLEPVRSLRARMAPLAWSDEREKGEEVWSGNNRDDC